MFLALPSVASAQWGGRDRDDDRYGNRRYNRNIRGTLQSLKNKARNFENATNRVEDRRDDRRDDRNDDRWGGIWGNNRRRGGDVGRLEDLADRFRKATDDLADDYGNGRDLNGSRDEARRVLEIGNQIENEIRNIRGGRNLDRQWSQIRSDLNINANHKFSFNYLQLNSSSDNILSGSTSAGFGRRQTNSDYMNFQGSNYAILENRKTATGELNSVLGSTMANIELTRQMMGLALGRAAPMQAAQAVAAAAMKPALRRRVVD